MRLGLGPIPLTTTSSDSLRALAAQAAAASFDCVWVAESRAAGAGGGLAAAALVAQTVPIRAGALVDAGLYHPLYLAEDIAVADLTTGGRLEVIVRPAAEDHATIEEHLSVLSLALSGAHLQWNGERLSVPARLDANQPVPARLALNPRPAQPAVPVWLVAEDAWAEALARRLGFGVARMWRAGGLVPPPAGRLPGILLCPGDVEAGHLLSAAGEGAGYFIIEAASAEAAKEAGRRLAGPLRMPNFPAWINSE